MKENEKKTSDQDVEFNLDKDGDKVVGGLNKMCIDGKQYTPQEISAMILQKIKADTESQLGEKVTEAVITVPAYFNDEQ